MAKPWRRRLGLLAVMSYLSGLFEAAFLLIVTGAALALNSNSDTIELWGRSLELSTTLWIGAAVLIGRAAASIASSWLGAHVKAAVVASTRSKLMRSFVTTSYDVQSNEHPGTLHELMTTFSNQASLMISALVRIITASANLTALIGLAALVDPLGAIGLVVVIGFLALTLRPLRAVLERRSKQSADAGIMFANSVNETAHLGMELHVFDVGDEAADRVDREIAVVEERSRRVYFTTGLLLPAYTGLAFIAVLVALAIASRGSEIDLGSIGAVVLLMLRSLTYGQSLQTSAATMATAAPWIDKTEERLERYATAHVEERGISLHRLTAWSPRSSRSDIARAGRTYWRISTSRSVRRKSSELSALLARASPPSSSFFWGCVSRALGIYGSTDARARSSAATTGLVGQRWYRRLPR